MKEIAETKKYQFIIGGDFNCRIGKNDECRNIVGIYASAHHTSESGELLMELAASRGLRIENTFYKHKMSQRTSWEHPATKRRELLDFFLTDQKSCRRIIDVKSYPGLDCGSDHDLVVLKSLSQKKKRSRRRKPRRQRKLDKLLLTEKKESITAELTKECTEMDNSWKSVEKGIISAALKHQSVRQHIPMNKRWLHGHLEELKQLLERKWFSRRDFIRRRSEETYQIWKTARKHLLRKLREWKRNRAEILGTQIEEILNHVGGNTRNLFMELRMLSNAESREYTLCTVNRSVSDEVITSHFNRIFQSTDLLDVENLIGLSEQNASLDAVPQVEEVGSAIAQLKNGTAAGTNGIIPELFKWGGHNLVFKLTECFEHIWEGRVDFPESWKEAKVVIIYKGKGSRNDLNNYRGIFLLEVGGKIMARVIVNRLIPIVEREIDEWQFGFRSGRGTQHAICIIRKIQEEARYRNQDVYVIFIDLEKAFDSVPRNVLWTCLKKLGINGRTLSMITQFHEGFKGLIGEHEFTMFKGVRQGCVLGPILFNIVFDRALKLAEANGMTGGVQLRNEDGTELKINHLAYADDLCLIDKDYNELKKSMYSKRSVPATGSKDQHKKDQDYESKW